MDRIDAFKKLAAQAQRGELSFPTNVDATLKLQRALNDPDLQRKKRPAWSRPSPCWRRARWRSPIPSPTTAPASRSRPCGRPCSASGFRVLNALAAAVIVRQLDSKITDPQLRAKADRLWKHTAHVAALSQLIAKRISKVDPETAMFAGIVHEVGGFYLLSRAAEFPGLLDGDPEEWIEFGEMAVGRGVLAKLGVPAPVMQAIEAMWEGMRALPPETLGDTLMLANDLSPLDSPLHVRPGATTRQSAATVDFVVGEGTLADILAEAKAEVDSLTAALF